VATGNDRNAPALIAAGLPPAAQQRIAATIDTCRQENGLDVSVLVGDLKLADGRSFRDGAEQLHGALGTRSATAVLVVVAPGQRKVEIVTGPGIRRRVPDRVCALAVLSMATAFSGGDLTGGIVDALRQLAEAAGRRHGLPPMLEEHSTDLARTGH